MANEKQTAYFGQLGLMRLHQQEAPEALSQQAYHAAEKAFALDPTSAEAAQLILRKALEDEHWAKAIDCLKIYLNHAQSHKADEIQKAGDLYARLSLQRAYQAYEADEISGAINLAEQALSERANFIPASEALVLWLSEKGDKRAAIKRAQKTFMAAPHLTSLMSLRACRDDNEGQFISYATNRAQKSAQPDDGLLAVAQYAISVGIWASASQIVSQISDAYLRHNEFYMVQADIAKGLEDEAGYQQALQLAASAPRASHWQCRHCATTTQHYHFNCPSCALPGQMRWQMGFQVPVGTAITSDALA